MAKNDRLNRHLPKHEFVAGRLCLDFCNTLPRTWLEADWDRAKTPDDFLAWARRGGLAAGRAPDAAALARLLALRDALARIFDAVADGKAPEARDLDALNAELADARAAERLVPAERGFVLEDAASAEIDRLRHAVVRDAEDLLTGDLRRIKRCPDHDCLWFFYDASKNLSRRWCAMDDCGTKDKVRRFRERERL